MKGTSLHVRSSYAVYRSPNASAIIAGLPVRKAATYLLVAIAKLAAIATYTTRLEELKDTCFRRSASSLRCLTRRKDFHFHALCTF